MEILASALGLQMTSKSLSTPGIKQPKSADTTLLDDKDREIYRSNVMRLAYLAQDRIELPFSSKELARNMQAPTRFDMEQLKRAVRFLIGTPRLVQRFAMQSVPEKVTSYSDTDHAGCLKTRKSTSCTMIAFGKHLIRSSSTTQ